MILSEVLESCGDVTLDMDISTVRSGEQDRVTMRRRDHGDVVRTSADVNESVVSRPRPASFLGKSKPWMRLRVSRQRGQHASGYVEATAVL